MNHTTARAGTMALVIALAALAAGQATAADRIKAFEQQASEIRKKAAQMSRDVREALEASKTRRPPAPSGLDPSQALSALDEAKIGVPGRFIVIQPGSFVMGSPKGEGGRFDDETQHTVTLTKGYEIQATEVTQLQYALMTGGNPSRFKTKYDCSVREHKMVLGVEVCVNNPIETVSWDDAQNFISRLNQIQDQYTYRLPTEAEWEYAARAGTLSAYAGDVEASAWYENNSGRRTHAVASKQPNSLGLHDMAGNVWEWAQDWYGKYSDNSVTDPKGPDAGSYRVFRGGSWDYVAGYLRSARRGYDAPGSRDDGLGLRLVRSRR